jgi:hypothetical protein
VPLPVELRSVVMHPDLDLDLLERIETLEREAVAATTRAFQYFREPDVEGRLESELSRRGVRSVDETWLVGTAKTIRLSPFLALDDA